MSVRKDTNKNILGKDWLIRSLAERSGFCMKDAKVLINTLTDIIFDAMENPENTILLMGLFKIYSVQTRAYNGYNPVNQQRQLVPSIRRIVIKPSPLLNKMARGEGVAAEQLPNENEEKDGE